MAVAQAGGLNLKLTIVDLPAMKAELPFGQVVLLSWKWLSILGLARRTHAKSVGLTYLQPQRQIPYMVDGDIKLAHSNAILRYVARKAGLEGESIQAYAASNMLIEEVA